MDRHRQRGDWHETDDWDLELQDELGGHGFLDHVYKTWKEVADRINRFGSTARINNASSRFADSATANQLAHQTLQANKIRIEKWLANRKNDDTIELIYAPPNQQITGFSLLKGSQQFIPVYKVKMVLIPTGKGSYRIKTFYPYQK